MLRKPFPSSLELAVAFAIAPVFSLPVLAQTSPSEAVSVLDQLRYDAKQQGPLILVGRSAPPPAEDRVAVSIHRYNPASRDYKNGFAPNRTALERGNSWRCRTKGSRRGNALLTRIAPCRSRFVGSIAARVFCPHIE